MIEASTSVPAHLAPVNPPKNLCDLGVGDLVIIRRSHHIPSVAKIDRVTKTQILIGANRFRRTSGHIPGSHSWGSPWISAPKDDQEVASVRLENKRARYAQHLIDTKWASLPLETMERVIEILSEKAADAAKEVR